MLPEKVFSALSSRTRIEILRILAMKSRSVMDVKNELNRRGFEMKYRESVYRALNKLVDAGLVEKFYDKEEGGIKYGIIKKELVVDLQSGKVR